MLTLQQAFDEFRRKLELTEAEDSKARKQHPNLRGALAGVLDVERDFLSGSFARHTAIRPLNDIDIFMVLRETQSVHRDTPPDAVLNKLAGALAKLYPRNSRRTQPHSVKIEFANTGIAYDVVPAFDLGNDVFTIPDGAASAWIRTNPKRHQELSTQANERSNKKLKPLLKAVKHANNHHNKPARSFHLEVLSWKILRSDPGSWIAGLVTLFDGLARRINDPCPDPAGLGPDIRPDSARCRAAEQWLSSMAKLAREAAGAEKEGRLAEAHAKLRKIFGKEWP